MRFIDEAKITLTAGHGGKGCVSFRREKFVPRGGPDGGDGGRGGSIRIKASNQLSTLQDFRFKRNYQAPNGRPGSGTNKAGQDGEDIEIRVPVGTIVRDAQTGETLLDFTENGQEWVACLGGRGGKGNAHFATSTFQAPKFAQPGEPGETREISLELKLLADVGIVGFPNAGKSTFISKVSAARPKIADYPFTTLVPNLGVVSFSDYKSAVFADIPGLIENAHQGQGLGHKFLRHIERTRLFLHLIDGSTLLELTDTDSADAEDLSEALLSRYDTIRKELTLFAEDLSKKPEIVVINKSDVLSAFPPQTLTAALAHFRAALQKRRQAASLGSAQTQTDEPFLISAVSGEGLRPLLQAIEYELWAGSASHPAPSAP